ncbi:MAG: efflux RND transporter periplasmic adaptor subunit, partial [Acidimicrobiales bacterium]
SQAGGNAKGAEPPTTTASVGDVVVTVGGLGRVVEAAAGAPLAVPVAAGASGSGSGAAATTAPAAGVFPTASGRVASVLVAPGDQVGADQVLAVLDDGGSAAATVFQTQNDLSAARLELEQKQANDPAKGGPATSAEVVAAQLGVEQAHKRLAQLSGPPDPADVTTALLEVAKARADLEVVTRPPSAASLRAARLALDAANQKIAQVSGPAPEADVAAARVEVERARSELVALQRSESPSASAVEAAQIAVDLAILKLAQLTAPPNPADVAAAGAEVAKADAELDSLQRGPASEAVTMGRLGVTVAEQRLAQVLQPLPATVDGARLDAAKAIADVEVLRQRGGPASRIDISLGRLRLALATANAAVAQAQVDRLTVRARAPGVVTALLTAVGAPADPTTPIATVADLNDLAVNVDLSEFDAARVQRGQSAAVSVDALGGRRLAGTVLVEALAGVDNGGVVTFPVRIGLRESAGVKPGMGVSVRIVTAERRNVVRVPVEAVSGSGKKATVTVVSASGATARRAVKLGLADNKLTEVRSGLRSGERVRLQGGSNA